MDKYDNLGLVGEGSYGMVMKCRHKETNQLVAIKKFIESEDDRNVKKIAMREIKMLRSLQHDHLVNLLEVFRKKKRLYLVFEFVDHTVLDDLEKYSQGLEEIRVKKIMWQVLKGTEFCHQHNIIHRDIKPENILVSRSTVVKLCDFGFARSLAAPGEVYTDYVATRWYRSPELLVGETSYGKAVDIWAIGCLLSEMLTGDPLFPGDSDLDQLHLILKCFGPLISKYKEIFFHNPLYAGMRLPEVKHTISLEKKLPKAAKVSFAIDFMKTCMKLDAADRPSCTQLLRHGFFTNDGFSEEFPKELKRKIEKERMDNAPLYNILRKKKSGGSVATNDSKSTSTSETKPSKEEPPKKKTPPPVESKPAITDKLPIVKTGSPATESKLPSNNTSPVPDASKQSTIPPITKTSNLVNHSQNVTISQSVTLPSKYIYSKPSTDNSFSPRTNTLGQNGGGSSGSVLTLNAENIPPSYKQQGLKFQTSQYMMSSFHNDHEKKFMPIWAGTNPLKRSNTQASNMKKPKHSTSQVLSNSPIDKSKYSRELSYAFIRQSNHNSSPDRDLNHPRIANSKYPGML